MRHKSRLSLAFVLAFVPVLLARTSAASPQSGILGWGYHVFDSRLNEEQFVSITAGGQNTIALRAAGTLAEWGDNFWGEGAVPALPAGLTYLKASVSAEPNTASFETRGHTVAVRSDGTIVAWGDNSYGQCNVPSLPAGITYTTVAAGGVFTIAARSDGHLVGWGSNSGGMCNVPAPPPGLAFVGIAAGFRHVLGLRSDGSATAWGQAVFGCCSVPALPSGVTYVELSAGQNLSLARRSDGTAVAFGDNYYGQCNVPALPPGTSYVSIAAGAQHCVACRSDGQVVAWGFNQYGQCNVPPLPSGLSYVEVAAGLDHSVARRSDGTVVAWGSNDDSQCNVPALPSGLSYAACSVGKYDGGPGGAGSADRGFVAALRSDGQVVVWGSHSAVAPALPAGLTYTQVSAGYLHCAALRSDGAIVAWGNNSGGECNVPVLPAGLTYVGVEAGGHDYLSTCGFGFGEPEGRTFGLRSDGALIEWGTCTWEGGFPPLPVGLSYDSACMGGFHALARRSDGSAVVGGIYGLPPVPPCAPGVSYVALAAGGGTGLMAGCQGPNYLYEYHSIGLCSDGTVLAWGKNNFGECNVPPLPPGLAYVDVAAGPSLSIARRSDGSVVAWGDPARGQCNVPMLPAGSVYADVWAGTYCAAARYGPAPACGSVSTYCYPAKPNSASAQGAQLAVEGCPGLSANNLVLEVSGLPPSRTGLFLYGSSQQQISFGNGWGCVAGGIQRVLPAILSSPTGAVSCPVDLTQFPYTGSAHAILAGSAWNFQFWYRDPTAPPSQFNLSDALHISFAP